MQKLKRNPLYRRLVYHGYNKVMNAFTDSRVSSDHDNKGLQKNKVTPVYVESINEILQKNKVTPVYVESINEIEVPPEIKAATSCEFTNEKTVLHELKSVSSGRLTGEITASSELTTETQEEAIIEIIFGILLIFVDLSLVIVELFVIEVKDYILLEYHSISLVIALFFLMDVLLRVYLEGKQHYFSDLFNILNAVITGVILLVDIIYFFHDLMFISAAPRLTILFRLLRLVILMRVFHLAYQKRYLEKLTRRLVSENKRRYQKDGFDLDLTYVTDRIIAMSFPSSGSWSLYRNPIKEVVRFLDTKHSDHYQVYNLCSERAYDPKYFHYRVQRIKIDDHNVPTLKKMLSFTKEVEEWMAQDKENVVAVHCKGGKGRTGTMVCAYLITCRLFLTAKESTYYFGERRTDKTISTKFQGIETPSQKRYVGYFEKLMTLYNRTLPPRKILIIKKFIIYSIHGVGKGDGSDLKVQIIMQQEAVFSCSSTNYMVFHDIESDRVIINIFNCPALYDEVKVKFLSSELPKYYDNCPFFFWFHTSFIHKNRLYLPRNELDNLHKPKTWKIYSPGFAIEVYFDENEPVIL
ncbi:phosphatidylinositol 3,4,5-trisphosphate 3-phosphatase TPTE2-like isoform X2 [Fukomys damarensis]|uniref:phosphatidylinositol 3,4,5-trisphosphate 3-phosphatase TPTE2-like isoform X2 n=1 Tax=Fukomys damarensis TaxID=885580 RepID=UPI0014558E9C|nr:phosphatidylinositol 3,4,5-trisphosphate 3-phosphatase TPTE2-like isoform X2 [Fukomys damarensis]